MSRATDQPSDAGPNASAVTARARWQQVAEWAMLALGAALYIALPHVIDGDAGVRYSTLEQLLEQHKLSSAVYSIVQQLFTIPLYLLGRFAGNAFGFVSYFNTLTFFGGLAVLYWLLRRRLDPDLLRRFLLLLTAGSMFTHHIEDYYGEVFTTFMVAIGLLLYGLDRFFAGSTLVVIGIVNTPAATGGLALVAARAAWKSKRWIRWATPVIATVALILLESWIRRGNPLHSGYEGNAGAHTVLPYSGRPGFSYPLFLGVLSELFSFGRGIIFFAPGLLLAFTTREPFSLPVERFYRLGIVFLCGLILVYGKWWAWYGGWFWGPRFLLFAAIPSSLLLAYHVSKSANRPVLRVMTVGVLWLSIWVGASGAVFGQSGQEICQQNNYALESLCWYVPEFSALILPFITPRTFTHRELVFLAYFVAAGACLTLPLLKNGLVGLRDPQRERIPLNIE